MIDVAFAIPGDISAPTGGYAYDRKLLALLPDFGVMPHHVELPGSFPYPSESDLARTKHVFAQIAPETVALIDGLALGAMPPETVNAIKQPIVALVHHPLAYETGISAAVERQFRAFESHALSCAQHVIVSSNSTAALLRREFGVPGNAVTVAEPGTGTSIRAMGSGGFTTVELLAVGSIVPRKGFADLIEALKPLQALHWRLTIAGSADRDPKCANDLRERILRSGMRGRITLAGALSHRELQRLYTKSDIFVMPSRYEGYGMAVAEAVARGLPIVCTTGGATAETAPDTASIKVPPANPTALSEALNRVIVDRKLRQRLADNAWEAAKKLPRWETTVARVAEVLKVVSASTGGAPAEENAGVSPDGEE